MVDKSRAFAPMYPQLWWGTQTYVVLWEKHENFWGFRLIASFVKLYLVITTCPFHFLIYFFPFGFLEGYLTISFITFFYVILLIVFDSWKTSLELVCGLMTMLPMFSSSTILNHIWTISTIIYRWNDNDSWLWNLILWSSLLC